MKKECHGRRKRWSGFWGRPVLALGLALGLIVTTPLLGRAAEITDVSAAAAVSQGSLTVKCSNGKELDRAGVNLEIDLYKVAGVSIGNDNICSYTNPLGGITVGDNLNSAGWRELTQEFAKYVLDPDTGKSGMTPAKSVSLETRTEVDTGLYLLVARGGTEDYVTTTAAGDIVTRASKGEMAFTFSPVLVSVPSWDTVSGEWQYHMEISLKAEQDGQSGSLKIVKTLQGSATVTDPVTFVFEVEGQLNGEKVYSNVVTLVFDGPGQKELLVEKIPVGTEVTVTEVYTGASCRLVTSATQTATIAADAVVSVAFTNEYDGHNGGKGITNHFRHEADGWKLDQLYDKSQG